MAKAKHTPGPWLCKFSDHEAVIYNPTFGAIAKIPHEGSHKEEHEANAFLSSKAPELATALRGLLFWDNGINAKELNNAKERAAALLAKSTLVGRPHPMDASLILKLLWIVWLLYALDDYTQNHPPKRRNS